MTFAKRGARSRSRAQIFFITTVNDKGLLQAKAGAGTYSPAYVAQNDMAVGVSERLAEAMHSAGLLFVCL